MRSFGGDLVFEPHNEGTCFAVVLPMTIAEEKARG
jgi:hypothetical protein